MPFGRVRICFVGERPKRGWVMSKRVGVAGGLLFVAQGLPDKAARKPPVSPPSSQRYVLGSRAC